MNIKPPGKPAIDKHQPPLIIDSAKLFGRDRRIQLLHEDKLYQLTITRQNKLILTK